MVRSHEYCFRSGTALTRWEEEVETEVHVRPLVRLCGLGTLLYSVPPYRRLLYNFINYCTAECGCLLVSVP